MVVSTFELGKIDRLQAQAVRRERMTRRALGLEPYAAANALRLVQPPPALQLADATNALAAVSAFTRKNPLVFPPRSTFDLVGDLNTSLFSLRSAFDKMNLFGLQRLPRPLFSLPPAVFLPPLRFDRTFADLTRTLDLLGSRRAFHDLAAAINARTASLFKPNLSTLAPALRSHDFSGDVLKRAAAFSRLFDTNRELVAAFGVADASAVNALLRAQFADAGVVVEPRPSRPMLDALREWVRETSDPLERRRRTLVLEIVITTSSAAAAFRTGNAAWGILLTALALHYLQELWALRGR